MNLNYLDTIDAWDSLDGEVIEIVGGDCRVSYLTLTEEG